MNTYLHQLKVGNTTIGIIQQQIQLLIKQKSILR